ncbi:MAG TPA: sigma-70 family RNA polymerase sigma factor [Thermoanaerobaculia bacterium]|nr:sigma-70 family RNA polymerase sigma factor [Thermoanaerobaculia bacterium]
MASLARFPAPEQEREGSGQATDEKRLLEAVRGGDRDAAEAMVERTYSAVYASLFRLCSDRDLAADLTQETYQKAWAALRGFDGRSQLFTWLYRIAYTTFLNHVRRPRRTTSLDESHAAGLADEGPGADQVLFANEESRRLRAAVLRLPEDLRFTVTAHFWGGLPVKEIARIEEITTVAIRKRLHKAFSLLEAMMDEDST